MSNFTQEEQNMFSAMFGPDLAHIGTKFHSGRYPYGSGEVPYQHDVDFITRYNGYVKDGLTKEEIAELLAVGPPKNIKYAINAAKHNIKVGKIAYARQLADDGLGATEIGRLLDTSESTVRGWITSETLERQTRARNTYEHLKNEIKEKGMIDLSAGAELELGVSRGVLDEAAYLLKKNGYFVETLPVPQPGDFKKKTNTIVAGPDDTTYGYAMNNLEKIKTLEDYYSTDGGKTYESNAPDFPASFDSKRLAIRYREDGGIEHGDGTIELRRGCKDLDMGGVHYAQVRILVDGDHYLKGMAYYSDNLPPGVDMVFNTNKSKDTPKMDVLKKAKFDEYDPNNPFGAYFDKKGQRKYIGEDGKEHLSPINKIKSEGEWEQMSKTLSSQMVSKQPVKFINERLNQTFTDYKAMFEEINSITNPTLRKEMLLEFADEVDSAQVTLKAAALPRQRQRVLLPGKDLKDNECYAPTYKDGETVYLIRYPHGSTREIPVLTVNNKNRGCIDQYGKDLEDAICINSSVAGQLSGADFDGDTVTVIPRTKAGTVQTRMPLKELTTFEPQIEYPPTATSARMKKKNVQREMGTISNLITDMTLKGADDKEIVRAIKHSMVVIDAEKKGLDYKLSEKTNGVDALKNKWQKQYDADGNVIKTGGASTLISRRKQDIQVPERRGMQIIDKNTGEVSYKNTGRTYIDLKTGKKVLAYEDAPLMVETKDARTLSSGTQQENAYAGYINRLKGLAAEARKGAVNTVEWGVDKDAKARYAKEVESIDRKLTDAKRNAPRERLANRIARQKVSTIVKAKGLNYKDSEDKKTINKITRRAVEDARAAVGASGKATRVVLSDSEWEAIQSKAVPKTKMKEVFKFADRDELKTRALPKQTSELPVWKVNKIKTMQQNGYTIEEIADSLKVSTTTVSKKLHE